MTVLIGVPQELEEAEDPEVQIVLLIAVKQKVCSCMSALQLKLINIRDLFVIFFYRSNREHLFELFWCISSLPENSRNKTKHDYYKEKYISCIVVYFYGCYWNLVCFEEPLGEKRLLVSLTVFLTFHDILCPIQQFEDELEISIVWKCTLVNYQKKSRANYLIRANNLSVVQNFI